MGSPETPGIPGRVELITDLRALRRALEGGIAIDRVVCPAGKPYLPALYQLVRRYNLRVQQVPPSALPKGATWGAAYVSPVPFRSVEELLAGPVEGLLVALVGITDVRNVGAIVRSAAAFSRGGLYGQRRRRPHPLIQSCGVAVPARFLTCPYSVPIARTPTSKNYPAPAGPSLLRPSPPRRLRRSPRGGGRQRLSFFWVAKTKASPRRTSPWPPPTSLFRTLPP